MENSVCEYKKKGKEAERTANLNVHLHWRNSFQKLEGMRKSQEDGRPTA